VGIKSNTSPDLYLSLYIKLVSADYEGYNSTFTDGSKQGMCIAAAAAVSHDKVLVNGLPRPEACASLSPALPMLLATSDFQWITSLPRLTDFQ
jgi:hypothetical protein